MKIGSFFTFETLPETDNGLVKLLLKNGGDLRHLMSGRCAIYYALQDSLQFDKRKVTYLPAYTCETVTDCFVKAGYEIYYYDVDKNLTPQFDESIIDKISNILICGYFGFSNYDVKFIEKCKEKGICIIQDTTHSIFSKDGISPLADYIVVSFRKWFGVPCGGIALKKFGKFNLEPIPVDEEHLNNRTKFMLMREESLKMKDEALYEKAQDLFWSTELKLRKTYDVFEADKKSIDIITHYPLELLYKKRRENFEHLLKHIKPNEFCNPVFKSLPDGVCPTHFSVYSDNREVFQKYLSNNGISTTIYWPVLPTIEIEEYPNAKYVTDHIISISCDQRYNIEQMDYISKVVNSFKGI